MMLVYNYGKHVTSVVQYHGNFNTVYNNLNIHKILNTKMTLYNKYYHYIYYTNTFLYSDQQSAVLYIPNL